MKAADLVRELKKYDLGPYVEIPCTILAPVISELSRQKIFEMMNPANEAVAMGLAAGSYLATSKIPVLLIQNSGLCNTLNALTSLNQIYSIPLLYLISWRGAPGSNDAPEHYEIGHKMTQLLKTFNVPYATLTGNSFGKDIRDMIKIIKRSKRPAALLLKDGLIETKKGNVIGIYGNPKLMKDKAIDIILNLSSGRAFIVSTNGYISREVFNNLRKKNNEDTNPPFYMLGSMGHALPIAIGAVKHLKGDKKMIVLDGDGGCLMHLGAMASVGVERPRSLIHVVLDNGVYASTGWQPTVAGSVNFCEIAKGCGYRNIHDFKDEEVLKKNFLNILNKVGPTFVHLSIGDKEYGGRPRVSEKYSCKEIKERFSRSIRYL